MAPSLSLILSVLLTFGAGSCMVVRTVLCMAGLCLYCLGPKLFSGIVKCVQRESKCHLLRKMVPESLRQDQVISGDVVDNSPSESHGLRCPGVSSVLLSLAQ